MNGNGPRIKISPLGDDDGGGRRRRARQSCSPPDTVLYGAIPYVVAEPRVALNGCELHEGDSSVLATAIADVVAIESPVHVEEVAQRIARSVGVHRVGARILDHLESAARLAVFRETIVRRGNYLWSPSMEKAPVRDRGALDGALKRIDHIAPEELVEAVSLVASQCTVRNGSELVVLASRIIGLKRAGTQVQAVIGQVVDIMIKGGQLVPHAGLLEPAMPTSGSVAGPSNETAVSVETHRTLSELQAEGRAALKRAKDVLLDLREYDWSETKKLSMDDLEELHRLSTDLASELGSVVRVVNEMANEQTATEP